MCDDGRECGSRDEEAHVLVLHTSVSWGREGGRPRKVVFVARPIELDEKTISVHCCLVACYVSPLVLCCQCNAFLRRPQVDKNKR